MLPVAHRMVEQTLSKSDMGSYLVLKSTIMASKKKLRKRINALLMELDARTAVLESRERDMRVVLEGKDTNRILQIRTRTRIMDDMGKWLWYGETRIGKGFMHQIKEQVADVPGELKTQKEIEDDTYMNKNFWGGYDPNANKTQSDVPGELKEADPIVESNKDAYSKEWLEEGMVELRPRPSIKYDFSQLNKQTDGLKKEEKKEEVRLPETDK
jgi:hypothetical protein